MIGTFLRLKQAALLTIGFLFSSKLRSLLSVLGVTIGIFCIVAVLTATGSLEKNIRSNIDKLGDKIVYVQKWPWGFGGNYQWWEYMNRPETTEDEYERLKSEGNPEIIKQSAFLFDFGSNTLKSPVEEIKDIKVQAIAGEFFSITQWELLIGREFSRSELERGKNVAIIGYTLAASLYQGANPLGKTAKLNGIKVTIIGVLDKKGNSMGGPNYDEQAIVPAVFAYRFAKPNRNGVGSAIVVKGHDNVDLDLLDFEITRIMRSERKLSPKEKDNFAINKLTMFSDNLNQTFSVINAVAWLIGGFSLLVGGFGIANIMFVSVKERTSIIGLQKALGAKRSFILSQFIIEAIILCIVGAFIGIFLVFILSLIANSATEFTFYLSVDVMSIGLVVAILIGLIAGIAPAFSAARLDPVVALRK